ncbi:MAG: carboxypeptidase-like regulatory domain-containing protein [Planctomycetaceae bacterium]|jgi:hypothetical protein|nr:carboxypeptidase-like regulatory domain-containing protein [Planctomycetaceae bacterium]
MKTNLLPLLLCLIAIFSGCNSHGFVPTGGKVTFEDGSPLTKGKIAFSTATFMAEGTIQPDGTFTLTSLKPGDGLPPGNYQVTISASETDANEKTIYLIDHQFEDPSTTPLTAEVTTEGKNLFDFKVSQPKR